MYILINQVIYINFKQKFQSGTLIEFGKQLWRQNIFTRQNFWRLSKTGILYF